MSEHRGGMSGVCLRAVESILLRNPEHSSTWIPAIAPIPNPSPFTGEGGVEQFAAANWMLKLGRNDELALFLRHCGERRNPEI